jgi:hypothetical protein
MRLFDGWKRTSLALPMLIAVLASATGAVAFHSSADARCASRPSLRADVARSLFVVEAAVVSVGRHAQFHTVAVWKGDTEALAHFTISAGYGGPVSPWPRAGSEGSVYLLFLSGSGEQVHVRRCGRSGLMTDALRDELLALGLTRTPR